MTSILFLIPTLQGGGAEKVLINLVNNLNSKHYDITVKTLLNRGVFEKQLNSNIKYQSSIKIENNFIRKILLYIISFLIPAKISHKLIVKKKYDIEIAYLEGVPTKIIAASNNKNSRKIAFVHTDLSENYRLTKVYKNVEECHTSYKKFDNVVFVSHTALNGFEKFIGTLSNSFVLHNVIDEKKILKMSKEFVVAKPTDKVTFLSIGRLSIEKGYDRLIDATKRLNNENFNFEIHILGEGDERKKLESLIAERNIENIKLLGFRDNPYPYMAMSDMVISSSRVEGYSTVIVEALILNKAVLTTNCAGMDEILDNGKYGIIVDNSVKGIYEGLKSILEKPDIINRYENLAKERSCYFSTDTTIRKFEELFNGEFDAEN